MFYMYILYSKMADRYYVGQTIDLKNRLESHNSGASRSTAYTQDWILVYTETFATRQEAIKRERYIKSMKNRKYIERLLQNKN